MHAAVRGALLAFCLVLAGCGLTGKRAGGPDGGKRPFLGGAPKENAGSATAAAPAPAPSPTINGILAGQVLDRFNRRQPSAFIQVVDLSTTTQAGSGAKVEVATDSQGYFTIQGLQPNRHYQLIARSKDGEKVLTGSAVAMPPNPRLSIFISDDLTSGSTPPVPPAPAFPNRGATGSEQKPAATIDPPTKMPPEKTPPEKAPSESGGTSSAPIRPAPPAASVLPVPPLDPSKVVVEPGGFARVPPATAIPSPPIESTPPPIPAPPTVPLPSREAPPAPMSPASPIGPTTSLPGAPPPVPYCVLIGRKLDNFALNDVNGQPWEYKRDRSGRLVLLDFWYSSCGPCLQAIPHLGELQRQYGSFGLEVVGVACERGKPADQAQKVRSIRARYNIPYRTLMSGGGTSPCPVVTQFEIHAFPTLILLDESGQIVWRSEGLDARQRWELETEIRRRLGIRSR